MTRPARIFVWTLTTLFTLLAILVVIIATFDWNRVKPLLNEKISEALHRPFAINGNLAVHWRTELEEGGWRAWVPWPHFIAEDLTLGNPDWLKEPQMVGLERVEFRLAPLPLVFQRISIPRIDLTRPTASLTRLADGRANWTFDFGPKDENEEPSSWQLDIGAIGFDQGNVSFDDQTLKTSMKVQIDPLGKPIPFSEIVGKASAEKAGGAQDYAFGLKAQGRYKGQPVSGTGKIGGLLALQDASQPFPLQADVRIADTHVVLAGTLTDPRNLGALDLRLRLSGASLGNLYPLTGVTLPDTPPIRPTAGSAPTCMPPKARPSITRASTARSATATSMATWPSSPASHAPSSLATWCPTSCCSGPGPADRCRFQHRAEGTRRCQQTAGRQGAAGGRVPHRALAGHGRRRYLCRQAHRAQRKLPFNDLSAHVILDDGLLRLEPLRFGVAGGSLASNIRLDGRNVPLQGRAQLTARGFKLKELFPTFAPMQTSFGELNGDADISGRGNSVAALLGTANGNLRMLINDGAISRSLMEIAGLNVGNYVVGKLFGDEDVKINCAAADVGIKDGLATTRLFIFDTENAIIYINGTANFASEQLDLKITRNPRGCACSRCARRCTCAGRLPPSAGVQAVPLALRGAGMVALGVVAGPAAGLLALVAPSSGDEPNQCTPLLQQMKAGKAPAAVKKQK